MSRCLLPSYLFAIYRQIKAHRRGGISANPLGVRKTYLKILIANYLVYSPISAWTELVMMRLTQSS